MSDSKDAAAEAAAAATECTEIQGKHRQIQFCIGQDCGLKRYSRYPSNQEWYYVPWDRTSLNIRHILAYKQCYELVHSAPSRILNLDYHAPPEEDDEEEEEEEEEKIA